jgi:hypothetical protein
MHEKGKLKTDLTVKRHFRTKKGCCAFSVTLFLSHSIVYYFVLSSLSNDALKHKSYPENTRCYTIICLCDSSTCLIASYLACLHTHSVNSQPLIPSFNHSLTGSFNYLMFHSIALSINSSLTHLKHRCIARFLSASLGDYSSHNSSRDSKMSLLTQINNLCHRRMNVESGAGAK